MQENGEEQRAGVDAPGAPPPPQPPVKAPDVLPAIASGGMVLFPGLMVPLGSADTAVVQAVVEAAASPSKMLALFAQKPEAEGYHNGEPYAMGTAAAIIRMVRDQSGAVQAIIQGAVRVRLLATEQAEPSLRVRVESVRDQVQDGIELEALTRTALSLFQKVVSLTDGLPDELALAAPTITAPGTLADLVAAHLNIKTEERQAALETVDVAQRLRLVTGYLQREVEVLQVENEIQSQVRGEMEKNQRQFILREQLKAIQRELGESELSPELGELRKRVEEAHMPEEAQREAERELERLATMPQAAAEYQVSRTYLEWLVSLPWDKSTEDNLDLARAEEVLNADHYGLDKVKRRILDFLAVRKLKKDSRGPILCFVGPPGTGKTSLGQSIARALGRKFVRMSLGGMRDEAEIRGHRRTYVGALPGRIIQGIRRAESNNPLFMLDEVDKLGVDFRGDPASALLEVLDPEQNYTFVDNYLDVAFDLSRVMFITTANLMDPIPAPLLDRMEIIELPGYTEREKLEIAKRYLAPRQMDANGLRKGMVKITDEALLDVIRSYTREAGVRNLEREIGAICRGVAREVVRGETKGVKVTLGTLSKFLGPRRVHWELAGEKDEVGVATAMAATAVGGDILHVEATCVPGKGRLTLTGKLGDVMQESAQAAVTYARSRAEELGIEPGAFESCDMHIHIPAGAIPKDGPSAGVTMATALVSALTKRPVRKDVAMTGEITLRGKVLPVGAIRDKVLAAHRAGIKRIILPKENEPDLEELAPDVRQEIEFILAEHVDEVLNAALHPESVEVGSRLAKVNRRPSASRAGKENRR
ncbi:MAG: endopeptidase La [Dehalococcoidia bacterium]|nr:endopeptidase La [Dehalococcoidia bacterium]